jgi:phosphatidylglycerophosphate synthase
VLARGLGCRPWHPLLWATYVLQQADLYLHLGLNRGPDRAPLRPSLPVATECTLLRAYAAAALLAGTPHPRRALVVGALSDLIDGALARRAGGETALGGLLDGEYDAYLLLAAAHAARRQGRLAPAAERLLWLRFIGVLLAGAVAAVAGRPVSVHSSGPGKVASGLQAATVYGAMAPGRRLPRRGQVGTVGLSTVLAVGGQIHRLWAAGRAPCSSSSR